MRRQYSGGVGRLLVTLLLGLVTGCAAQSDSPGQQRTDLDRALVPILAGDWRSEAHRARDRYRHPRQTLAFFGVRPDQTIVEIWPGGEGWYTEILAPLVRERGRLYAAHFSADAKSDFYRRSRRQFDAKLVARPDVYDRVVVTTLQPPGAMDIAPPGSADRVLTFRNVHNWLKAGTAQEVFAAFYRALKPGGVLGIVEHRARPGTPERQMIESGYVTQARVIWLAQDAGFEYLGSSEVNANPRDDTDHPAGVWTLPPTLRLGDRDRAVWLAIGESDRMTLRFAKPAGGD